MLADAWRFRTRVSAIDLRPSAVQMGFTGATGRAYSRLSAARDADRVLRDPTRGPGIGQFAVIQAMAPPHAVELTPIDALDPVETQSREIAAFASFPNSGMIVTVGPQAVRRDVVIAAAAKGRLPTIYPYRYYVGDGGLISYGPDTVEQFRRAAGYVDRILKGEKPADLPVQAPTGYQLAINLKTAMPLIVM
jgi:putative tryptophan/tyrosine transport system substrate-binding protein